MPDPRGSLPSITPCSATARSSAFRSKSKSTPSRGALMQADQLNGGQPVTERRAVNDTRGHVSELLAKCISKGALDEEISAEDRERMIAFLRQYGDLNRI